MPFRPSNPLQDTWAELLVICVVIVLCSMYVSHTLSKENERSRAALLDIYKAISIEHGISLAKRMDDLSERMGALQTQMESKNLALDTIEAAVLKPKKAAPVTISNVPIPVVIAPESQKDVR